MSNEKSGSETMGSAGPRNAMTIFKDDRQEDIGAIFLSILIVALAVVMTHG